MKETWVKQLGKRNSSQEKRQRMLLDEFNAELTKNGVGVKDKGWMNQLFYNFCDKSYETSEGM